MEEGISARKTRLATKAALRAASAMADVALAGGSDLWFVPIAITTVSRASSCSFANIRVRCSALAPEYAATVVPGGRSEPAKRSCESPTMRRWPAGGVGISQASFLSPLKVICWDGSSTGLCALGMSVSTSGSSARLARWPSNLSSESSNRESELRKSRRQGEEMGVPSFCRRGAREGPGCAKGGVEEERPFLRACGVEVGVEVGAAGGEGPGGVEVEGWLSFTRTTPSLSESTAGLGEASFVRTAEGVEEEGLEVSFARTVGEEGEEGGEGEGEEEGEGEVLGASEEGPDDAPPGL